MEKEKESIALAKVNIHAPILADHDQATFLRRTVCDLWLAPHRFFPSPASSLDDRHRSPASQPCVLATPMPMPSSRRFSSVSIPANHRLAGKRRRLLATAGLGTRTAAPSPCRACTRVASCLGVRRRPGPSGCAGGSMLGHLWGSRWTWLCVSGLE